MIQEVVERSVILGGKKGSVGKQRRTAQQIIGKLREKVNDEIFDTVTDAKVITEQWRIHYNNIRPHSSLGYRPPAPETHAFLHVANA